MVSTSNESAVSWGAVFAGAVGAAAISLVLFELGMGLGMAAISPWARDGVSATTVGVSTIVWLTVMQLLASVLGGYLAGRLRTRWVTVHTNEVFFRDTAHGFLAWAVATLAMATLLSSAVGAVISAGARLGGSDTVSYQVDSLLRSPNNNPARSGERAQEVTRIFANALKTGELEPADSQYLGEVVAANTGVSKSDAEQRVRSTFQEVKQATDDARKASAWLALWLVVSMFVGAFVASVAAIFGGRLRDSAALAVTP